VSGDKVDTVAGKNEPPGKRLFFRRKYRLETREKRLFRVKLRTPNVDLVFSYPRGGRGTAPICRKDPIGHGLRIRSRVTSQNWLLHLQRRIRIQRVSPVIHGRDARATIASWHGRPGHDTELDRFVNFVSTKWTSMPNSVNSFLRRPLVIIVSG